MTFGKTETLLMIGTILRQDEESAYDPLCRILYKDVNHLMNKYCQGIQFRDKEDLIQEVVSKVILNLPRFYKNSVNASEAERNAWLKTIVINARNDYFRRLYRSVEKDAVGLLDSVEQTAEKTIETQMELRESLFEALSNAFRIDTSPEKLMAFVYNCLLGRLTSTNGSPKKVTEEFEEVALWDMYQRMVYDLSDVLHCPIPEHILKPLKDKVEKTPDKPFRLSPRSITESSSWIVKTLKEQQKNG